MFNKVENIKDEIILMTLSEIVPKDHFLRKVDKAIDFKFIYDLTEKYYSHTTGRNSLDPVVLFKLVFLKDFYGIKSMRETIKRIETDAAFRWFLGIPFTKPVPHYSTFSQNYIRRFQGTDVFEQIFINIVNQAIEKKLVGGNEFFTDSTHIKANANKKKFKVEVTTKIKKRKLDLEKEITINPEEFLSKGRNTPYANEKVNGIPVLTISSGKIAYIDKEEINLGRKSLRKKVTNEVSQ